MVFEFELDWKTLHATTPPPSLEIVGDIMEMFWRKKPGEKSCRFFTHVREMFSRWAFVTVC